MSSKRYPEKLKTEAVKQVVERGHFSSMAIRILQFRHHTNRNFIAPGQGSEHRVMTIFNVAYYSLYKLKGFQPFSENSLKNAF